MGELKPFRELDGRRFGLRITDGVPRVLGDEFGDVIEIEEALLILTQDHKPRCPRCDSNKCIVNVVYYTPEDTTLMYHVRGKLRELALCQCKRYGDYFLADKGTHHRNRYFTKRCRYCNSPNTIITSLIRLERKEIKLPDYEDLPVTAGHHLNNCPFCTSKDVQKHGFDNRITENWVIERFARLSCSHCDTVYLKRIKRLGEEYKSYFPSDLVLMDDVRCRHCLARSIIAHDVSNGSPMTIFEEIVWDGKDTSDLRDTLLFISESYEIHILKKDLLKEGGWLTPPAMYLR